MKMNFLATAALVATAGCMSATQPQRPETKPSPIATKPAPVVQLAGTSWEIVSINGTPVAENAGGDTPSIAFTDGARVAFTGGCNRFMGGYAFGGPDVISFSEHAAGTKKACTASLVKQDARLMTALQSAQRIIDSGAGKAIVDASGAELVLLTPAAH
ncbi:MAG: META domain-containing protein [Parvularculaceae bacterium]|nr:META domain-containing protein [Parvularculaceae bacterium]